MQFFFFFFARGGRGGAEKEKRERNRASNIFPRSKKTGVAELYRPQGIDDGLPTELYGYQSTDGILLSAGYRRQYIAEAMNRRVFINRSLSEVYRNNYTDGNRPTEAYRKITTDSSLTESIEKGLLEGVYRRKSTDGSTSS